MAYSYAEVEIICKAVGFRCTPAFAEPLMSDARERALFGGWRSAKTARECLAALLLIMDWYYEHVQGKGKRRLIWIVGPDYKQTAEEYRYLSEWMAKLDFLAQPPSTALEGPRQLLLKFNVVIETKSADRPETLASVAPDFILSCETGQMPEAVRDMLRGRAGEKNAPIIWGGTVEDDEGHPQWAWYQEMVRDWLDNPTNRHRAWELPTWDNPLWDSCESLVNEDPHLAIYCPDDNHGPAHGGRNHPIIRQWEETYDPFTFARRIAAIPTGVQYAVYPQTTQSQLLLPVPQSAHLGFYATAGGVDFGSVHPSALVVVQLAADPRDKQISFVGPAGIAWVRECAFLNDGGNAFTLQKTRKEMADRWKCYRWNVDPNERYLARSWDPNLQAVSYSESGREARISLVTARLSLGKLKFDMDGPGVPDLYEEMKRVHRRRTNDGQLKFVRLNDDRTAALEDAIEALDGMPAMNIPKSFKVKRRDNARQREFSRRV